MKQLSDNNAGKNNTLISQILDAFDSLLCLLCDYKIAGFFFAHFCLSMKSLGVFIRKVSLFLSTQTVFFYLEAVWDCCYFVASFFHLNSCNHAESMMMISLSFDSSFLLNSAFLHRKGYIRYPEKFHFTIRHNRGAYMAKFFRYFQGN